ncbi:hypothetical protein H072_6376 [Dactylellina haptotyla CBS 200.50]|uniref:Uncharacterized protein n=1 Tax=Dactylellina haptotyla (strain CBS 200.50) TaxID=1284197 RepID=S8BXE5_DACHA|nr:hypothetical protein H072_6376 [Dactylellina haptotyla CBS 200.50]
MTVLVDYTKPRGESITLGMARLKSTSKGAAPQGTLLLNPGGPGGVATSIIFEAAAIPLFSDDLRANYDIVGLDPRGIGSSTPLRCDPDIWNKRVSMFPTTESEYQALVAYNTAVGNSCLKLTGNLFNHLSTLDVIEDMEMFRQAIHNENSKWSKLNFIGFSYGTLLGTQYAEKYPEHVGRFVLDGIVDHTLPETATLLGEAVTYESTLNQFFLWCDTSSECALRGQDVAGLFDTLIQNATKSPIPAPGCPSTGIGACYPVVSGEDVLQVVQGLLVGPNVTLAWPVLGEALAEAAQGNATLLSVPKAISETFGVYPFVAVGCQDWFHKSNSLAEILGKTRMTAALAPHTKGSTQSYWVQVSCIGWPAPTSNPQRPLEPKVQKAPPMLLINALHDPETSISWAVGLAALLPKSVLLTRIGSGHTSYAIGGEAMIVANKFLITGDLPAPGSTVNS